MSLDCAVAACAGCAQDRRPTEVELPLNRHSYFAEDRQKLETFVRHAACKWALHCSSRVLEMGNTNRRGGVLHRKLKRKVYSMRASSLFSMVRAKLTATPIPVSVGYEVTHSCNLSCAYCDRHRQMPHEMILDQILAALFGLKSLGMREISLDGGEPLVHREIDAITEWLAYNGIAIRLSSNGILIPRWPNVVQRCAKVKVSLDGPESVHDAARGVGAYHRAIHGALAARELGVDVEFTCVLGRHNAHAVDALMDIANRLEIGVVFQPARDSLFVDGGVERSAYRLTMLELRRAMVQVEHHKRIGSMVANHWSSLRHFRSFPKEKAVPCAAGWINLTMDPEGMLYHCGQIDRRDKSCNVVELGVEAAFARLTRGGCGQCWCARVVEENYTWGGRFDRFLPLTDANSTFPPSLAQPEQTRRLPVIRTISAGAPRR